MYLGLFFLVSLSRWQICFFFRVRDLGWNLCVSFLHMRFCDFNEIIHRAFVELKFTLKWIRMENFQTCRAQGNSKILQYWNWLSLPKECECMLKLICAFWQKKIEFEVVAEKVSSTRFLADEHLCWNVSVVSKIYYLKFTFSMLSSRFQDPRFSKS